ncbi:S8 family serine peptidase [Massilia sp. PAMC28688]|uniref:S8 family serine peptidase n=1 Tax=Massilia sp. PAMC28688 TaxID=2861283 RepID=UPI001C63A4FC|nr:S8 family serine peptidase [Massilia sp. PAMC28688]QYF94487.1 S8 family serine peptidase [Massilia sp. PAMC28688]
MRKNQPGMSTIAAAVKVLAATVAFGVIGNAAAAADTTRVIVAFKPGSAASVKSAVHAAKGNIKHDIFGMDAMAIEVPLTALKGLQHNPNVAYVEEDVIRRPFASTTPSTGTPYLLGQKVPYGIKQVQADLLPDTYVANRKVCIIDSGIDRAHEDFVGSTTNMTGEYDAGTGNWYTDENSHGTHVAGTIAAVNNGVGVVGVNANKRIKLHIVKVFGKDGWAYSSSLASAANKCAAAGANVISMSLGGGASNLTEQNTFANLQSKGILNIAAAGNDGNTVVSYPAGYSSVMMVGAIDENRQWATFSQYNSQMELAGPGVAVVSTIPTNTGTEPALKVGTSTYAPGAITGSPVKTATAPLANFGLGDVVTTTMTGKVCLIQRGTVDFATKVGNCQKSGGVGAVIYNNVAGGFGATLGTTVTTIPSVTASDTEGAAMKNQLGQSTTVALKTSSYAALDGTSMATPAVSGVAALVWSYFPTCTGSQIRTSLIKSAMDLGTAGRDVKYGYGLVQARAAYDRIRTYGCGV